MLKFVIPYCICMIEGVQNMRHIFVRLGLVHVKDGPDSEHMYTYQVSHSVEELKTGAKSKYYPVEMSEVLAYVRSMKGVTCSSASLVS